MYFLQFTVSTTEQHPRHGDYGGGIVNCWIERDTIEEAETAARSLIPAAHWSIVSFDEAGFMTRHEQESKFPAGLQYFDQAEIDREVFVFHTYPAESELP